MPALAHFQKDGLAHRLRSVPRPKPVLTAGFSMGIAIVHRFGDTNNESYFFAALSYALCGN